MTVRGTSGARDLSRHHRRHAGITERASDHAPDPARGSPHDCPGVLETSDHRSVCPGMGEARYRSVCGAGSDGDAVAGEQPEPRSPARQVAWHVTSRRGVEVQG